LEDIKQLDRLFNPSSVAIVGASKEIRKSGGRYLAALINGRYSGRVYAVNPGESEIMGLNSYSRVQDIPDDIDLAMVTVPARVVPQVIADCSQKGVRFAVVHSAGFSELGGEGEGLEAEMLRNARRGGTRIIGPNCMGFYCPQAGINTVAQMVDDAEAGPVAFVGQSGWATENMMVTGSELGLRFSKVVSIGNQSDLTVEDMLEYFASDEETRVIGFYIEGIKRGKDFLRLASQASKKKPVVVWKSGRTEAGARAAASHTGSLAGHDVVVDAALTQSGVAIARNLEELFDLVVGFTSPVLPRGNRLGLLVEAGGGAVAGADAATALGFELPMLSDETQEALINRLKGVLPPFSRPRNPVDIVWAPATDPHSVYLDCCRAILKEVDSLVMINYGIYNDYFVGQLAKMRDEMRKPILVIPGHPNESRDGMRLLTRNGIPSFTIPERALKALSAMLRFSNYRHQS
jgi:acyl-CoA synthetase (NDP forming)